jgi:hypothetical protein
MLIGLKFTYFSDVSDVIYFFIGWVLNTSLTSIVLSWMNPYFGCVPILTLTIPNPNPKPLPTPNPPHLLSLVLSCLVNPKPTAVQSTRQSHLTCICILCLIQHASLKLHIVNLSTILIPYSVRVYPKVSYSYTVHTGTYRRIYIHASKASWT